MLVVSYGPYEAHGVIRHKIQRIRGLLEYLTKENYLVEIVASAHLNRISIFLIDREIFRGDIRYLPFNLFCEDDPLCQRVANIIKMHMEMFYQENNIPKFDSTKRGCRWPSIQLTTPIPLKFALNSDISVLFEVGTKNSKPIESSSSSSSSPSEEYLSEIVYPEISNEIDDNYWNYQLTADYLTNIMESGKHAHDMEDISTESNDVTIISEVPTVVITCVDDTCRICKGEELVENENEENKDERKDEGNDNNQEWNQLLVQELEEVRENEHDHWGVKDEVEQSIQENSEIEFKLEKETTSKDVIQNEGGLKLDEKEIPVYDEHVDENINISINLSGGF